MRILPVLDLMKRLVVRAQGGRRKEYRPLVSGLIRSSHPLDVAQAFRFHFGLKELYLADLDAIAGRLPAVDTFASLRQRGFRLWLEAGIRQTQDAEQLAQTGVDIIVAGLETLAGPEVLDELCRLYSPARIVFSLDLKDGQPFGEPEIWGAAPMEIVRRVVACGIQRLLVLDLARVGGGKGLGTDDLLRKIATEYPHVELSAGGGVRGPDDLASLKQTGIQVALVASALHDGRLKRSDLEAVA
jgi:phosphoribosylformimino-5-aminoimidazole carboxamide ribotide isomerase